MTPEDIQKIKILERIFPLRNGGPGCHLPYKGMVCTLALGHSGCHVAHGIDSGEGYHEILEIWEPSEGESRV